MLKLVNITKYYEVADTTVRALRGIDLCFRESEFVSVLGPSGCGKTTLLNLIGGLDRATSGDLQIYGKSTKDFSDRDWDVYRNHRIGFIFQSYNLIPHQTVLGNVELALTIAGMDKAARVAKAKAALDKVGLSDQYYKRPNQLSGGQSQRVAIARALVNDPEILLADEPTGALDTVTSKQIMDLVKEIAQERLVIMVTHNPELAEEYSTRIIRLLDGNLLSDSNPFSEKDEKVATKAALAKQAEKDRAAEAAAMAAGKKKHVKKEKAKMSFRTAFKLSLQNLFTKKRRTIMTAIAGSIGIIGVSLVLSISVGLQGYINHMQNDMLSGNPIEIRRSAFDLNAMMSHEHDDQKNIVKKNGYVNVEAMLKEMNERLSNMQDIFVQNSITKDYVDYISDMPPGYLSALFLNYGLDVSNSIYTDFSVNKSDANGRPTSLSGISATYTSILEQIPEFGRYASMIGSIEQPFRQAPDSKDYLESQYTLEYGRVATEKNEIMIVLDKNRQLTDLLLAQLGYYSQEEFINLVNMAVGSSYDSDIYDGGQIEYSKIIGKTFTWYPNDTIFIGQANSSIPFKYSPYADAAWEEGLELTIVGILEPKDTLSYGTLTSGFYYTTALAEHIIEKNWNSEIAQYLRTEMTEAFAGTAMMFRKGAEVDLGGGLMTLPADMIHVLEGKVIAFDYDYTFEGTTTQAKGLVGSANQLMALLGMGSSGGNSPTIISFSNQSLGGGVELNITTDEDGNDLAWNVAMHDGAVFALPNSIAIYPVDLAQKDNVLSYLKAWNSEDDITLSSGRVIAADSRERIVHSDMLSLIMGMIQSLVQIITIALVGFTSLALVVSCVMIAIITYVSVVERIKEIGVIRSLGGRKRDVSNLFIAETFMIGLASGIIGIAVTYLLSALINAIVSSISVVATIAFFPWYLALTMLCISIGLTLISGLTPSRSAAKKDPVVALRTE
ncbi:MAG: ABC transporter ATP-binding protein/permease [Clostridiales bacterium]|nr:ABC transporter ATP-binding protein/permease [Clostridiales bacterium]